MNPGAPIRRPPGHGAAHVARIARGLLLAWLHAIALAAEPAGWTDFAHGRWKSLAPASGTNGFSLVPAAATGIAFTNHLADSSAADNRVLENGSGVALGDVDGDGLPDIYLCRLEGPNALYRNLGGWRFEDITARAMVACDGQLSTGAALADVDGDGDLDLIVNATGKGTRLFLNDGAARFTEKTDGRLAPRFGATSMALADMDGDGDLDLYVANYRTDTFRDDPPGLRVEAVRQADGSIKVLPEGRFVAVTPRAGGVEVIERGERDFLYINQGGGRFAPVSWTSGAFLDEDGHPLREPPTDWGLAVQFRDINGDGLPDLYVCNDFAYWPDRLWLNDSGARFKAAPRLALRHQSLASMSVDVADIDRDGRPDIFVADMTSRLASRRAWQRPNTLAGIVSFPVSDPLFRPEATHNTLHVGRDDGTFAEIARFAGVATSEWSWSAIFLDVDLDGWEDLLVATGNGHDVQHADVLAELATSREPRTSATRLRHLSRFPQLETPLVAFRNRRDRTFSDASGEWRFNIPGVHTGMALADLDADGDLDVVLNRLNGPAALLRNDAMAPRIAVALRGAAPNTRGIGARIRLHGGPVTQSQEMLAGGRYLSSDDPMRVFAAGGATGPFTLEVDWRDGTRQVVRDVVPGRMYEVVHAQAGTPRPGPNSPAPPLLAEAVLLPAHVHRDEPFDDFARQRLLPWRVSTRAPVTGWIDLDGDGRDELFIGGGRGHAIEWRKADPQGRWQPMALPSPEPPSRRAVVAVLSTHLPGSWLAALSTAEDGPTHAPCLVGGTFWGDVATAAQGMNPGSIAAADVDGDGEPELFVGDRGVPGHWPRSAASRLLARSGGRWRVAAVLPEAGMVTGALFTDLDDDGDPDLVTAAEAGEVRAWRNEGGRLSPWTIPGLSDQRGWWLGLAAGDFDEDGRMDLVAANRGLNFRAEPVDAGRPGMRLAWGAFAGDGTTDAMLGAWDPAEGRWFPRRDWRAVGAALPWVSVAYPSHALYGRATFDEVLSGKQGEAKDVLVANAASMIFLNRGERFDARPLPAEAQWSSAHAVAAGDIDGDGHIDLVLAQNDFHHDLETTRQDAGTGLVLRGDGTGRFVPAGPAAAGMHVPGQGRSVALADMDGDGRTDVGMGVHEGDFRLFRNSGGAAGVVMTNMAAGSRVRWRKGDRAGPVHEARAGNGSNGQDSLRLVVTGMPEGGTLEAKHPARRKP